MEKKSERMIDIYLKLINGNVINKRTEAIIHNCSPKSIQRDIEDLRDYIFKKHRAADIELVYDSDKNGYLLLHSNGNRLTEAEIERLKNSGKYTGTRFN